MEMSRWETCREQTTARPTQTHARTLHITNKMSNTIVYVCAMVPLTGDTPENKMKCTGGSGVLCMIVCIVYAVTHRLANVDGHIFSTHLPLVRIFIFGCCIYCSWLQICDYRVSYHFAGMACVCAPFVRQGTLVRDFYLFLLVFLRSQISLFAPILHTHWYTFPCISYAIYFRVSRHCCCCFQEFVG